MQFYNSAFNAHSSEVVSSKVKAFGGESAGALYDAGANPTHETIRTAIAQLGPVDGNNGLPMSLGPGKYASADVTQTSTWTSPCRIEGAAYDENDTCFVPDDNWETVAS